MLSIRTQDRMSLVPYKGKISIWNEKRIMIGNSKNFDYLFSLGTYATKERALEVLDEIQKATIGRLIINNPQINSEHWTNEYVTYISQGSQEQIIPLPTVYQMPKE